MRETTLPHYINIPDTLVDQVLSEVRATPFPVFEAQELEAMQLPCQDLHQQLFDTRERRSGPEVAKRVTAGYFVAHRVLRTAFGDEPLPSRTPQEISSYMAHITDKSTPLGPKPLDAGFAADYVDHAPVIHLVNDCLSYRETQFGAKIVFELVGGPCVNPERWEALGIPSQSTAP